jgi:dihydrodipicolinate synthase/N-acetylneuraminate lyase
LGGTWGTVLIPWRHDDSIDLPRLRCEVSALVAAGLDGVYAHGTAGEFHALSDKEFCAVSDVVAELCGAHSVPFQIGASHMSAQTGWKRAAYARGLRPVAIQVTLPDWLPLTLGECQRFLHGLAEVAAPVALVLYNPPHAKTVLSPAQLAHLADTVPQLVGLKTAGGDEVWHATMRTLCPSLAVFVPGHHLASGYAMGAAGSFSNIAALSPAGAARWWQLIRSDNDTALEVEKAILNFFADHITPLQHQGYGPPALDKTLAHIGGWADIGTRVRWPASSVPVEHAESLRAEARSRLPLLFDSTRSAEESA